MCGDSNDNQSQLPKYQNSNNDIYSSQVKEYPKIEMLIKERPNKARHSGLKMARRVRDRTVIDACLTAFKNKDYNEAVRLLPLLVEQAKKLLHVQCNFSKCTCTHTCMYKYMYTGTY